MQEEEEKCYRNVCDILTKRYLRKQLGRKDFTEPPDDPPIDHETDLLMRRVDTLLNEWSQVSSVNCVKVSGGNDFEGGSEFEGGTDFGGGTNFIKPGETIQVATASV